MNLVWVLLGVVWLLSGGWDRKWNRIRSSKLLHAYVGLFVLYVVGLLWSSDLSAGLTLVRQMLPVLIVPLVVLSSDPLEPRQQKWVRWVYVVTVLCVSCIGVVRFLTIENLPYRDIVPYISHIRFSLNVCVVICVLFAEFTKPVRLWAKMLLLVGVFFLLGMLLLLQSYTGVLAMAVTALVTAVVSARKKVVGLAVLLWALLLGVSVWNVVEYYTIVYADGAAYPDETVNLRPYNENDDMFIESGGYVHRYVCREELEAQWALRSDIALDSVTSGGYSLYTTLIRYLNAMHVTKDSVGVSRLTDQDVAAVEQGIANPVYLRQGSIKKFYSVLLFEYETHRRYGQVSGFSMLQRLELWKAGWKLFASHPVCGVGPGDLASAHQSELLSMQSVLSGTSMHIHNQYLTWMAAFGLAGALLLVVLFARGLKGVVSRNSLLAAAYLTIILVSFIGEDTLDTLAGRMFFVYFVCFINHNVPISHTS